MSEENKNQTPDILTEISIVDMLDIALVENYEKQWSGPRRKAPLRPSSAGKCTRALAPAEDKKEPATIRLLDVGSYIEKSMINHLRKLKEPFGIEVKYEDQIVTVCTLADGTIIEGEIDFALEGPGVKILGDSKTTKVKFSSHMTDNWEEMLQKWRRMPSVKQLSETCYYVEDAWAFCQALKDDFKIDNVMQVNMYLGSDFFRERGYEHGALYYYLKNDSRMYELRFKFNQKLHDFVKDRYETAKNVPTPEEAPKSYNLGSIRCAFCPYSNHCWSTQDPLKAYFNTLPKKQWAKDLSKVKDSDMIEGLFNEYEDLLTKSESIEVVEDKIAQLLAAQKVSKIKRGNGDIWEVKILKSPREHFVLRRSKN
jgi:hypothetical protein